MRLIDADELLTAFPADDEPTVTKSCVRMTIHRMPTVDAVPVVHGRWIVHYGNWADVYECDRCHHESKEGGKYCSNCGTDMRGNEDEQNQG